MALTKERKTPKLGTDYVFPNFINVPVKTATTIYAGALVALNAGYAVPASTATGLVAVGIAEKTVTNSGADGAVSIDVRQGAFKFNNSGSGDLIAQTDVGADAFIVDDQTVAKTSGSLTRSRAGKILQIESDGVWVLTGILGDEFGRDLAQSVSTYVHAPVADVTALAAIAASARTDGMHCVVQADNSIWVFASSSTAADTTASLVVTPGAGTGRWIRSGKSVNLKLAVSKDATDTAVLFTVPAGMRLRVDQALWEVTTPFTGGTSSAIGISSSNSGYSTKGDILGGSSGDLTTGLGAGFSGTAGAKATGPIVLIAADTIRFDRIASAFTAGAGFVHISATLI